jgi:aminoglycoside phosphotransferase family enzyme
MTKAQITEQEYQTTLQKAKDFYEKKQNILKNHERNEWIFENNIS